MGAEYGLLGVRASASGPAVHLSHRSKWLRAAVLGANDGIVSTASLVLGVAASGAPGTAIVGGGAGRGGAVDGRGGVGVGQLAARLRAGRYPPGGARASPQSDGELRELAAIYERRWLPPALASEVAVTLSRHGALATHTRDELGLSEERRARPFQAAWASAL